MNIWADHYVYIELKPFINLYPVLFHWAFDVPFKGIVFIIKDGGIGMNVFACEY